MASLWGIRNPVMDGTKVFVDGVLLEQVDRTAPRGLSRTAWISLLIQVGLANHKLPTQQDEANAA